MQMTLRWFGDKQDSVKLWQIRQIPGVTGVITMLYDIPVGEVWPLERIKELQQEVRNAGLEIAGIESVNVHDSIKIGLAEREVYIDNYIKTLDNLGKCGIKLVCYNFMPVFDWTRTDLAKIRPDGSSVLAYDQSIIDQIDPQAFFDRTKEGSNGFVMPGWEPERLKKLKELFKAYEGVDDKMLFDNLVYFLRRIEGVCEKWGIKMAIHPDDPAWPVFNLPRILTSKERVLKLLKAVDAPFNGLTFCLGSFGSKQDNDLEGIIRAASGRIHFAHIRNIHHMGDGVFEEAAHLSSDGSFDLYKIIRALYETGFDGPIRPDHGRAIWGEVAMPGYGLYDRALGAEYILGLWEALDKSLKGSRAI